jgi:hypothetical protein
VKLSYTIRPAIDDPNVVPDAGVVPVLRLGESAGLYDLLEEALTVDSPNATAKTTGPGITPIRPPPHSLPG